MNRTCSVVCGLLLSVVATARASDSSHLRAIFADPPRQYSTAPLWVWNDMLTEEQVVSTLRDLASQQVKQAFVHPRPGLMTPYLSDDWFRLWKVALGEAERLDMNLWIYDENSYPSGFAGGWVPELMPESRGRGLTFREEKRPRRPGKDTLGIFRLTADGYENVTAKARSGEALPKDRYLVVTVVRAPNTPWNGNRCYVDLMYPGVTEKFLDVTLEAYRRQIGQEFGKHVPGSFADEPNLRTAGDLPWTDGLPAAFQKRWGYSLSDHLPSLFRAVGPWKQVRHDYYRVLLEQYIEHWGKPYHDYCQKHGLEFTGHYWDHEWPECQAVPDNMAMNAWEHRPGIDCLMNQYREDTHAQFGNVRMVRELASVANQLGRERTLCEAYGAGGWDLRFEDMKRIGDWLEVLGINTLDQHVSYITLRGARKADHPQSFSYHEPWWPAYHVMAQYFTRLSAALSQGEQINRILVIEPTTTAWMYQRDVLQTSKIGKSFFDLLMSLEKSQVEYDIGCEDIIARHGSGVKPELPGEAGALMVGKRRYHTVVLPPELENLDSPTMKLLEGFAGQGGKVISCGPPPSLVDARPSDRGTKLARALGYRQMKPEDVGSRLTPVLGDDFTAIRRTLGDRGILFHHRRQLADGELLLLVNTSSEASTSGFIESRNQGAEVWDCHTGRIELYPFVSESGATKLSYRLPPCGSLLLFLSLKPLSPPSEWFPPTPPPARAGDTPPPIRFANIDEVHLKATKATTVRPSGLLQVRRAGPNVLTLDYMDVTAGGETKRATYFYRANQFAFAQNGMPQNPWDSAVQFKDELISKRFPPKSGFTATYHFAIEQKVPRPLEIVIERPDLYTITCNGEPVAACKGAWWLDKAFGRIDITAAAKVGENAVMIKASPMTIFHELEPAYLLGDFSVKARKSGFAVAPPKPLSLAAWDRQGLLFYAEGVKYVQTFTIAKPSGSYRVALGRWYGSVARVTVNGKEVGYVGWQPCECDVTGAIRSGANTIEVTVIGTLKNTLGPHHAGKIAGTAWPAIFHQGPETGPPAGAAYDTLGYGLFEPFVLQNVK